MENENVSSWSDLEKLIKDRSENMRNLTGRRGARHDFLRVESSRRAAKSN